MTISAYIIGGEKSYADQFIDKAHKQGIDLQMVGHRDWDMGTRGSVPDCDVILVLKDVTNHMLRDWAREQARSLGIKFCEVSQKISIAMKGLCHVLGLPSPKGEDMKEKDFFEFSDPSVDLFHRNFIENYAAFTVSPNKLGSRKSAIHEMSLSYFMRSFKDKDIEAYDFGQPTLSLKSSKEIKAFAKIQSKNLMTLLDLYKRAFEDANIDSSEIKDAVAKWTLCMRLQTTDVVLKRAVPMIFGIGFDEVLQSIKDSNSSALDFIESQTKASVAEPSLPLTTPQKEEDEMNILSECSTKIIKTPYAILGATPSHTKACCEAEGLSYKEVSSYMNHLRKSLKNRGKGLTKSERQVIQETKFLWALDLLLSGDLKIDSLGSLQAATKAMWATRISDKYLSEVAKILSDNSLDEKALSEISPEPTTVETATVETATAETATVETATVESPRNGVSIGSFKIDIKGAGEVSIAEMPAGDISVEGDLQVTIREVKGDTLYGVLIKGK
jgi:hypothetical protein